MRSYVFSFFLSFLLHGFIFSISPRAGLKTTVVRLDQIRFEKEGPVCLSVLPSPHASRPVSPSSPGSAPPPRRETKMLAGGTIKRAEKIVNHPPPLPQIAPPTPPDPPSYTVSHPADVVFHPASRSELAEEESMPQAAVIPLDKAGEGGGGMGGSAVEGVSYPAGEGILNAYIARLREKVEAARFYPDRARRMGQEGRVRVRLVIGADGQMEADLVGPSSFPILNQAAIGALRAIGPLPPLPPELGDRLEVTIPLVYRLERSARR
jgi:TonB family protein